MIEVDQRGRTSIVFNYSASVKSDYNVEFRTGGSRVVRRLIFEGACLVSSAY